MPEGLVSQHKKASHMDLAKLMQSIHAALCMAIRNKGWLAQSNS